MPIYEYQCQACEHEMEVLQKLSDDPVKVCPDCGKPEMKKKISAAGFRLKGGGWYETDFKTGNKKNLAGAGDSSKANTSSDSNSSAGSSSNTASSASSSPASGS